MERAGAIRVAGLVSLGCLRYRVLHDRRPRQVGATRRRSLLGNGHGGTSAMHSSLIGKVEKANRYARELDRVTFERFTLTFRGDNDTHHVTLADGTWHCTCHFFESWHSCVHLLALTKMIGAMLPEDAQVDLLPAERSSIAV
jgi:hypothetical protein